MFWKQNLSPQLHLISPIVPIEVGVINEKNMTPVVFVMCLTFVLSIIITLCLGFTNTFERYKKKQRKNAKKILKILFYKENLTKIKFYIQNGKMQNFYLS